MYRNIYLINCCIAIYALCFVVQFDAYAQERGNLRIRNYSPQEYGSSTQNWAVIQDSRGVMYFGNSEGILEYDGVSWGLIELPGYSAARSFDIDSSGRVYVGGVDEFGYLEEDKNGIFQYHTLFDKIADKSCSFYDFWNTCCLGDAVYFCAEHYIFCFRDGKMETLKSDFSLEHCFSVNGELYVDVFEKGIQKLKDNNLVDIQHGYFFKDKQVWYSSCSGDDVFMFGTIGSGLFTFDFSNCTENGPVNPPRKYISEAEPFLTGNYSYSGCHLNDGRYALALISHGLIVIDQNGKIDLDLQLNSGLRNDLIWFMYQDVEDNLWLATDNGISKIDISSPISYWGHNTGIGSSLHDIIFFDSTLYVAGFSGLFYLEDNIVKRVNSVEAQNYCFLEFGLPENPTRKILLTGADVEGICELKDTLVKPIIPSISPWCMHQSKKDLSLLFIGYDYGFLIARYNQGKWIYLGKVEGITDEIFDIKEDAEGYLWLTSIRGLIRILPSDSGLVPKELMFYGEGSGLNDLKEIEVVIDESRIFACTRDGLFYFDKGKNKFEPEKIFGEQFSNRSRSVTELIKTQSGDFWIFGKVDNSKYYSRAWKTEDGYETRPEACFYNLPDMQIESILVDSDNIVWMGGSEGLFRIDTNIKTEKPEFDVLIRKVTSIDDTIIYGGGSINQINTSEIKLYKPLDYRYAILNFDYAAPTFINESMTRYKYWLEGIEKDWSRWTKNTSKEYSYIPEGDYTFYVKARNIFGIESKTASISFTIDPPWYRSWWAYAVSIILIIALVSLIIYLKYRQLRKKNVKLEHQVKERTKEVVQKNEEIQSQSDYLQKLNIDLKEQNKEIEAQRDQLKKLNATKDRFFNIIAHDLKSPFQALLGFSDLLATNVYEYTYEEIEDISKTINESAERGFVLLEDLLQWASSQTNRIKCEPEKIVLNELIQRSIFSHKNQAISKQIVIRLDCRQDICVWADQNMTSTVLRNLLSNAIKFTRIGGEIVFLANENNVDVSISVKDNGVGIAAEALGKLFNIEDSKTTLGTSNEKGTGLGLVLCKEFVEANGGGIAVKSEEGKGSEFIISLPKCS
ncbi:MAG: hypothetical protein K9H64_21580 [Bacteroidales bacterium]|nr:hypothetical protein [Bacteroidales bacterium]MCF8458699.1 hypothetical protein [Bacteroidales bacterium]